MKKSDFETLNPVCYLINMQHATNQLTDMYNSYMTKSGITFSQFCLLGNLNRMGQGNSTTLAARCALDRTTIVRNLKPLEEMGLIVDEAKKGDRSRLLSLSEKGKTILEDARKMWMAAQKDLESKIGEEDAKALLALLRKVEEKYAI